DPAVADLDPALADEPRRGVAAVRAASCHGEVSQAVVGRVRGRVRVLLQLLVPPAGVAARVPVPEVEPPPARIRRRARRKIELVAPDQPPPVDPGSHRLIMPAGGISQKPPASRPGRIDLPGYLSVPVVELGGAADQVVEGLVVAPPDPDLVAVGVFDDAELVRVRAEGDTGGLLARVGDAMRAGGTGGKAHDVAGFERPFALGSPERGRPGDDDQPLLVAPVEVIGADRLPRRQLVDRHPEPGGSQPRPDPGGSNPEPGRIALVTARVAVEQVERLDAASIA